VHPFERTPLLKFLDPPLLLCGTSAVDYLPFHLWNECKELQFSDPLTSTEIMIGCQQPMSTECILIRAPIHLSLSLQGWHDVLQCWGVCSTTRQPAVDNSWVCDVTKSRQCWRKLQANSPWWSSHARWPSSVSEWLGSGSYSNTHIPCTATHTPSHTPHIPHYTPSHTPHPTLTPSHTPHTLIPHTLTHSTHPHTLLTLPHPTPSPSSWHINNETNIVTYLVSGVNRTGYNDVSLQYRYEPCPRDGCPPPGIDFGPYESL